MSRSPITSVGTMSASCAHSGIRLRTTVSSTSGFAAFCRARARAATAMSSDVPGTSVQCSDGSSASMPSSLWNRTLTALRSFGDVRDTAWNSARDAAASPGMMPASTISARLATTSWMAVNRASSSVSGPGTMR